MSLDAPHRSAPGTEALAGPRIPGMRVIVDKRYLHTVALLGTWVVIGRLGISRDSLRHFDGLEQFYRSLAHKGDLNCLEVRHSTNVALSRVT